MNNLFRGLIAGYGAKKLGGGCFGTVLVFILIWVALGECSSRPIPDEKKLPTHKVDITTCMLPIEIHKAA